jgi:(2Fe-2S) ferredoxin
VVILPHGLYYGHVTPDNAVAIARRHLEGRVTVESLRGRSTFAPAAQAAEHFVRLESGLDVIDALRPLDVAGRADGAVVVRLAVGEGVRSVVLREHESEPIPRLTCGARVATPIREWELVDLQ